MFFKVILHRWILNWQLSFLYFSFIGLMQCSKILSVISSTDWERTIWVMKLHQYFEFGPSSQDPFSFCQIQLALDTVWSSRNRSILSAFMAPQPGVICRGCKNNIYAVLFQDKVCKDNITFSLERYTQRRDKKLNIKLKLNPWKKGRGKVDK